MNSNLFASPLLSGQDPFENAVPEAANFGTWGDQGDTIASNGFQNDGTQMQGWNSSSALDGAGAQSMPPGLFAAIANAIAQYFQGHSQQSVSSDSATPFQSVNASSVGDPHNSVNGATRNGNTVNSHWDDMQSHSNLLSAPSVAGGLRFSSQVGSPNAQGKTMNQSVTATANHGRTAITFNANGAATVTQGNLTNTMVPNETLSLGQGLSVTDQGSSLVIHAQNTSGSMLDTTLSDNGQGGVDMNAQGRNIPLGGYLIKSSSGA